MSACVYDYAVSEVPDNTIDSDGYALALTIDLPVMDTRAEGDNDWEKYEDYVGKFSLLFFKAAEGDDATKQTLIKKCDSDTLTYFEVDKGEYGYTKQWYVRIPIDPKNGDDAKFIETIRGNDFKIAVLANWPGEVSLTTDIDNINALHHLVADDIYGKEDGVYYFLTDNGRMGATTDWVKENFESKEKAAERIKEILESSSQSDDTSSQSDDTASDPSEADERKDPWHLKDPCLLWESPTLTTGPITEETEGVFSFVAYASGTLSITAKAADDANGATITAQVGNTGTELSYKFESEETTIKQVISITGDEQRVYIYNNGESNVEISKIEYIQDEYLYEMDRTGVQPSKEHPIPMYGIQKFGKLEGVWKEGTVFDLSNFNKLNPTRYEGGTIQLLRSVAKVELLLPKEDFCHAFLRAMNRTAYSEPMDVATSTSDIWVDAGESGYSTHNNECEWSKLTGLTPFYDPENAQLTNYQDKLKWYYGSWGKYEGTGSPVTNNFGTGYPHILNPRIHRSEFVKFLKVDDDEYDRYVLYVPEKFVDDPTDVNAVEIGQSAPKVCHIEFRGTKDPDYNLDDNNCYRIYFTDGGVYGDAPTLEDDEQLWENTYENDPDVLKHHWTIMRNHIYTFTVEYNPGGKLAVQVKVLPWKRRKVEVAW